MSIKSELTKTASYLRSARKAILGRGGEISTTAGLKDFSDAIYKIPADASLAYQVDDSVAYQKIVPSGAEEYAQIAKVGGMTYKNNLNVLKITNTYDTLNEDGSITVATYGQPMDAEEPELTPFSFEIDISLLKPNTTYLFSLDEMDGDPSIITMEELNLVVTVGGSSQYIWEEGTNFTTPDNITSIIGEGNIYNGYADMSVEVTLKMSIKEVCLIDTPVTELVSEGANLIPFPYYHTEQKTINGVTWTPNADGSITANGTQTAATSYPLWISEKPVLLNGTYSASLGTPLPSGCALYLAFRDDLGNVNIISGAENGTKTIDNRYCYNIRFWIVSGAVFNNVTFYPMLNYGSSPAPYKPYRTDAVDTFPIPEAIQAIDGYGRGVNENYYNYIDYDRKVFVQNTYRKVFDGTENWSYGQISNGKYRLAFSLNPLAIGVANSQAGAILSNHYNTLTAGGGIWYGTQGIGVNESGIYVFVYDTAFNDGDKYKWKAHLAELYANGNPLIVEYAIAEPIETDISEYLTDNFIEVEGGGAITAVNEHECDAPSTINYIAKVGT